MIHHKVTCLWHAPWMCYTGSSFRTRWESHRHPLFNKTVHSKIMSWMPRVAFIQTILHRKSLNATAGSPFELNAITSQETHITSAFVCFCAHLLTSATVGSNQMIKQASVNAHRLKSMALRPPPWQLEPIKEGQSVQCLQTYFKGEGKHQQTSV